MTSSDATWDLDGIDSDTRTLAMRAAEAEGVPVERWLERTFRKAILNDPVLPDRSAQAFGLPVRVADGGRFPAGFDAPPFGQNSQSENRRMRRAAGTTLRRTGAFALAAVLVAAALSTMIFMTSPSRTPISLDRSENARPTITAAAVAPGAAKTDADTGTPESPGSNPPNVPAQPASDTAPATEAEQPYDPVHETRALAVAGDATAQYDLGMLYLRGDRVSHDPRAAADWFERAAKQGHAPAQFNLGVLHETGTGAPIDLTMAYFWYQSAAEQNHSRALHNLGTAYAAGSWRERNYRKAADLFRRASDLGLAESQYSLGLMYERGLGVPADADEAILLYRMAHAGGFAAAGEAATRLVAVQAAARLAPAAGPTPNDGADKASPTPAAVDVREIQNLLTTLGFDVGPVDGVAGPRTIKAIRTYQRFAGLPTDGKPSEMVLHDLRAVAGRTN